MTVTKDLRDLIARGDRAYAAPPEGRAAWFRRFWPAIRIALTALLDIESASEEGSRAAPEGEDVGSSIGEADEGAGAEAGGDTSGE